MLFSNDRVAEFINRNFEPAWESVRAVPLVTIDFGNGHILTRTLNGNIATYVCRSDGKLMDVLPGIYEPQTYSQQLEQFVKLHAWVAQDEDPLAAVTRYHQRQAEALADGKPALVLDPAPVPIFKRQIERPLKLVLKPRAPEHDAAETGKATHDSPTTDLRLESREDLARWKLLAEDTRINQQVRRLAIHRYLARRGSVTPSDITRWLYRDVLDADLDDPYLGLGKTLFASYPFQDP